MFGFLQRCEDEKFDEVMANVRKDGVKKLEYGEYGYDLGDFKTPLSWTKILYVACSAAEPKIRLEIAFSKVVLTGERQFCTL